MRRVTVIGGSGDVGALILPLLDAHHHVRVADLRRPATWDGDFIPVDVTDPASLATACADTDVLVYLAMGPKADWGSDAWARMQFVVNVEGLYSTLRAAAAAGVSRFVHASTGSIFANYLQRPLPPEGDAVDAYGLSKALAERVCAAAYVEHSFPGISLRLVGPVPDEEWMAAGHSEHGDVITAGSDIARAFLAAVSASTPGYETCMISGNYDGTLIDLTDADSLLGWRPLARRAATNTEETP